MILRAAVISVLLFMETAAVAVTPVRIGSKSFTESVVLAHIAADLARETGAQAAVDEQLGGTQFVWQALRSGQIDLYPEYTGTIAREILQRPQLHTLEAIRAALAPMGIAISPALGFNNTYALGMSRATAAKLGVNAISDLVRFPNLRFGFSNEFMDRADGWPGLRQAYRLPQTRVQGLNHDLAYRALVAGSIAVTDLYSTDAEIAYYHLRVLKDDRHFFPDYRAVFLYRQDLAIRYPAVVRRLHDFAGKIGTRAMIKMNEAAKIGRIGESRIAAQFLGFTHTPPPPTLTARLKARTGEHLYLVGLSLGAAIVIAIPLGIAAARYRRAGQVILAIVAIVQTIPSLALLVFMIPLLGIGGPPALAALFLYSLLPIVRNTHAGLAGIPGHLRDSARVLGLSPWARLYRIELPMALPAILAGIKTSAVINVGTATLGALIGAGGYGQPILTGIRLDDIGLILEGAVPAAVLALVVQGSFELLERVLVSPGLRWRAEAVDSSHTN